MLKDLLLVLNMLVCVALIGVVLLQRSEGGAFGTGNPTGLVTARGAGDLLTRTTWVLFALFMILSLSLTLIGGRERSSQAILERLKHTSVNPDTLHPAAPPPANPQSAPAPLQLPPMSGTASVAQPAPLPTALPAAPRPVTAKSAKTVKSVRAAPVKTQPSPPTITAPPPVLTPTPKPLALPPLNPSSGAPASPQ